MSHNGSPADPLPVYHIRVRGELDPAWSGWFEGMQIVPQAEQHTPEREQLQGDSAALRAWVAFRQGAFQQAAQGFQQALAVLPETASFQRGINLMFLGDAQQQLGDTRQAGASYQAALPWCRAAGNSVALLGATLKLATAYRAQGALRQARAVLQQAYDTLPPQAPQSVVYLHLGLAEVCYEQDEREQAAAHVQAGLDLVQRRRTLTHVLPLLLLAQARLAQAAGDTAAARAALEQAGEHRQVLTDARVAALFALRQVQLWLLQGDLAAAQAWNAALAIDAQQLFSSEVLLICRARILLALGRSHNDAALLHEAQALLAELEPQARTAGRHGHELLIALLQAQASAALEQREPARAALASALHLAEAEGMVFASVMPSLLPIH